MNLQTKEHVSLHNIQPVMKLAMHKIKKCYDDLGFACLITSTDEGIHKKGSLHYLGLAIDLRTRNIPHNVLEILYLNIKQELNLLSSKFQTILESNHIHVEYDRRTNK